MSVAQEIKDMYAEGVNAGMNLVGEWISDIINQDGENKTDSECLDEVIELLKKYKIYKEQQ